MLVTLFKLMIAHQNIFVIGKNFDISGYRNELNNKLHSLNTCSTNLDGNAKLKRFMKITESVVNKYLPLRPCTNKEKRRCENPWMTNAIYKAIRNKDKLYFRKLKHRTLINIARYKRHRNYLNRIIKTAKRCIIRLNWIFQRINLKLCGLL